MSNITPAGQIAPESSELEELVLTPAVDDVTSDASDPGISAVSEDIDDTEDSEDFQDSENGIDLEDDSDDLEDADDSDDSEDEDDSEDDDEIDGETDDFQDGDDEPSVPFTSLGLPEALTALLAREGVVDAFPIQAATIPDALAGRHVLGKARTGSGKTLAFGLPMLANLQGKRARKGKPLGLVLVPTRELAMQVSEALRPYGYAIGVDIAAVFGGAPMYKQVFALRRGVEVLVATPGRLTDLIEQEECSLDEVAIAVLDEADQMADMGFMPVVSELLSQTDPAGQRLLFSATLDGAVDELVQKYLTDPVLHSVASEETTPARMDHHLLVVEPTDKSTITAEIAARHTPGSEDTRRTILFARTKLGADRIAEKIREAGVSALALHGGMTQRARTRTLDDFKAGRVPVLVATDVAARGIHVDGIDLVLHVDPANDAKDYLHRAGRTARAGEAGTVVTLVLPKQRKATLRLLEQAGVEAELTKVAPSSDVLRQLTGGRPVAEYAAEAEAWRTARQAAREARFGERGERGDRFERGDRGGRFERGGDRFDRGGDRHERGGRFERPVRFEDRGERGTRFERDRARGERFGEARGGFDRAGSGERPGFGNRDSRGGFGGDRGEAASVRASAAASVAASATATRAAAASAATAVSVRASAVTGPGVASVPASATATPVAAASAATAAGAATVPASVATGPGAASVPPSATATRAAAAASAATAAGVATVPASATATPVVASATATRAAAASAATAAGAATVPASATGVTAAGSAATAAGAASVPPSATATRAAAASAATAATAFRARAASATGGRAATSAPPSAARAAPGTTAAVSAAARTATAPAAAAAPATSAATATAVATATATRAAAATAAAARVARRPTAATAARGASSATAATSATGPARAPVPAPTGPAATAASSAAAATGAPSAGATGARSAATAASGAASAAASVARSVRGATAAGSQWPDGQ